MPASFERWSLALALALLFPASSFAQSSPVQLDHYRAAATGDDGFVLSRPDDRGHMLWSARLDLDYALNPLVVEQRLGHAGSELQSIVKHQLVGHLGISLGLFERLVVYAVLPVDLVNTGDGYMGIRGGDGAGIGDLRLGARGRIWGEPDDDWAIAAQLEVALPLADAASGSQAYTGESGAVLHPQLLGEFRGVERLRETANLGARIRSGSDARVANLDLSHELTYALGITYAALPEQLDVYVEAFGAQSFSNIGSQGSRESGPFEGLLGARYFATPEIKVGLAAGTGFTRGYGSPDFRGVLNLAYTQGPTRTVIGDTDGDGLFDDVDQCIDEPEDVDSFEDEDGCPDPDNDADSILDVSDQCPMQPETANDYQDEDGCPDEIPDTDSDGLLDTVDQCVEEPEDIDEFQDEDGCPDPDNDSDSVLDEPDRCPLEAGPVENHGCPDTDRDTDTVVDRLDGCPDVPGPAEFSGCPNDLHIRMEDGRIEILDRVHFRTDRDVIQRRSFELLRNMTTVLNNHPEIPLIVVAGHTDDRGTDEHNMDLSQRRAEAVMHFLIEAGVSADRLQARGFGKNQPIVENASTREERAQNRRVEFRLPSIDGIMQQNSAAGADTVDR